MGQASSRTNPMLYTQLRASTLASMNKPGFGPLVSPAAPPRRRSANARNRRRPNTPARNNTRNRRHPNTPARNNTRRPWSLLPPPRPRRPGRNLLVERLAGEYKKVGSVYRKQLWNTPTKRAAASQMRVLYKQMVAMAPYLLDKIPPPPSNYDRVRSMLAARSSGGGLAGPR